jgi:glycyl-tRNA synthetase
MSALLLVHREVLIMVMRKHQRYFPVLESSAPDARLLPKFIAVANGSVDVGAVAAGNEAVLRARCACRAGPGQHSGEAADWLLCSFPPGDPARYESEACVMTAGCTPRFEDASFFYREDLKQPLEAFRWETHPGTALA